MNENNHRTHLDWGLRGAERPVPHPANMDQRPDRRALKTLRDVPTRVLGVLTSVAEEYQFLGGRS